MMKIVFCSFLLLIPFLNHGQSGQEAEVRAVIENLFKGMYQGDSSMVHMSFHDDCRLYSSMKTTSGTDTVREGSLDGFLKAIGTPHNEIWDERISNLRIDLDEGLAHAWMDYRFYRGDKFSHCGVNAMQLVRINEKWKIIHIIDTRKSGEKCNPDN